MNTSEVTLRLLSRIPAPSLAPSQPFDAATAADIEYLPASELVKMGLHVLNDDLPRAHTLAQAMEGDQSADYWHAIVHRREGDYSNAKYWLRCVGLHPVLVEIHGDVAGASRFVDQCRDAGEDEESLVEIQRRELAALLEFVLGEE